MRTVSIAGREAYLLEALNLAILAIQALPESKRSFYQEDKALFEVWFWETARLLQQSKAN
jgi:hypothetical protein